MRAPHRAGRSQRAEHKAGNCAAAQGLWPRRGRLQTPCAKDACRQGNRLSPGPGQPLLRLLATGLWAVGGARLPSLL